ncbi:MAG: hypothetical protein EOS18_05560 [Mesorhizobium sp.]|nr:MAG: hypothetical protein EOS18_05560 [Mesorhizobium sp.]
MPPDGVDTAYKRRADVMSKSFAWDQTVPTGTLGLVQTGGETIEGTLILVSEWKTKLPGHLT